jgi:MFS family permease
MTSGGLAAWRQGFSHDRALFIIGLGVAVSLLGDLTLYVVLPTHTEAAGIALADVGLMLSANRLIRIAINGPAGMLIERVPRRRMLVPALFIGALSSLLYTLPGFWTLLIGRLLWGTAWAGVWLGASTMVLDLAPRRSRGRYIGRLQMWFFIGSGGAALIGGVLTDWLGYSPALRVCSLITLVAAVMWLLLLPETRPVRAARPADGHAAGPDDEVEYTGAWRSSLLPLGTAVALLGVNWLIFIGFLGATLPLLLEQRIGETILLIGLVIPLASFTGGLYAANQVLGLIASPLSGWVSDRTGNRWLLASGALALGVVALALTATGHGAVIVLATMLGALATSVLQTQVMTLAGDYAPHGQQGRILGVINTVGDIGSAAGPLLAYALLPVIDLSGIFWLATGLIALCLPWTAWIGARESRRMAQKLTTAKGS